MLSLRRISNLQLLWLLLPALLSGCASLSGADYRGQYLSGDFDGAIATLQAPAFQSDRNALLVAMEQGSIYHDSGDYASSIKALRAAEKTLEAQETISASDQAKTMVANDWAASYKGEYSERLWVHSYLMMDYLLLNDFQSAAVEARKALKVFDQYPKALENDWFTRALVALSFEMVGKINDAYIEYKKLAELMPSASPIAAPLVRLGNALGFVGDVEKFKKLVPESLAGTSASGNAELILFVGSGSIPVKTTGELFAPPDLRISFPRYAYYDGSGGNISITLDNQPAVYTQISSNLSQLAQHSLDERGKLLLAKAAARTSIKHNLAHNIKEQNEVAGELVKLLFFVLEEADTRSWRTLPANLTLVRLPLRPGTHEIEVNSTGSRIGQPEKDLTLEVTASPGERLIRSIRVNYY